jgi:class 3 adenylate cyclase
MAVAGLPEGNTATVEKAVNAALEMMSFVEERYAERRAKDLPAFRMRVGLHTGPAIAGVVGLNKFQYDVWGDTVNTAARIESSGEAGKVNISVTTYQKLKSFPGFTFHARGKVAAKNKGDMEMYFVSHS